MSGTHTTLTHTTPPLAWHDRDPPFGMMIALSSVTIAAMLFMTILALAVVCRCDRRRHRTAVAVAVPVIEVVGREPQPGEPLPLAGDSDERAALVGPAPPSAADS
mmetsp:Transcript_38758/g.122155  ORF Transcript_38758/g.122155 Transcript_38758/m.122155 type:complete len:105 (+) Transcript_38758:147-461(+)